MSSTIIWTIAVITVLGLLLAVILYFVAERFKVAEDPRIDEVEKVMPGANCGGCGFAGCRAFAEAAVKAPDLDSNYCPVGGNEVMAKVAAILGYEVKEKAPQVAVVRCNGSCENRPRTNEYGGVSSCRVKALLYSGDTGCAFGCLGCGDCVAACPFDAIHLNAATGLPEVDEEKCTACGSCVKACPRRIIELRNKGPRGMRVWVSCVNREKGAVARKACKAACIGCGLCQKNCPHGAIVVENNLAYIDFTKCKLCRNCVAVCPTGAIHEANFPKALDKEAVKARLAEKAEAAAAQAAPGAAAAQAGPPAGQKPGGPAPTAGQKAAGPASAAAGQKPAAPAPTAGQKVVGEQPAAGQKAAGPASRKAGGEPQGGTEKAAAPRAEAQTKEEKA